MARSEPSEAVSLDYEAKGNGTSRPDRFGKSRKKFDKAILTTNGDE
jgi:hypothetical protein